MPEAPRRRSRPHKAVAAFAVLAFLFVSSSGIGTASPLQTPKEYALIYGTVWSPDNHPVHGATVKIRRADAKHARWERISDHAGEFAQRLPVGKADYVVSAEIRTEHGIARAETTVHIENDERADIALHLKE
jgi:hypothetical protein